MRTSSILLLLAVAACGNSISQEPVEHSTVRATIAPKQTVDLTRDNEIVASELQATPEAVWQALHEVHEVLEIPFRTGDLAGGRAVFQVDNLFRKISGKPASKYVDCGFGPAGARADSYRLMVRLSHRFESTYPGTTSLRTVLESTARNPGLSSDPVPCNSRGVLETEIAGMVALRLQPAN